jgi:hypothetical protein
MTPGAVHDRTLNDLLINVQTTQESNDLIGGQDEVTTLASVVKCDHPTATSSVVSGVKYRSDRELPGGGLDETVGIQQD